MTKNLNIYYGMIGERIAHKAGLLY